jgi:hypothetical protein
MLPVTMLWGSKVQAVEHSDVTTLYIIFLFNYLVRLMKNIHQLIS